MILTLDFSSDLPIYLQIRNAIVTAIARGEYAEGQRLPTVRALAMEAGINIMTVNKAYQLLKQQGYIITDRRNGAMVHLPGGDGGRGLLEEKRKAIWEELSLIAAEAKLHGISEQELTEILQKVYRR